MSRSTNDARTTLSCTIVTRTAKAILVTIKDEEDESHDEWFPLSQVHEIHNTEPASIVVSSWLYNKKVESWN